MRNANHKRTTSGTTAQSSGEQRKVPLEKSDDSGRKKVAAQGSGTFQNSSKVFKMQQ